MKLNLSHILLRHRYEAEDLQRRLAAGQDFQALAKANSTCPSAASGGSLGEVDLRRLDPDFGDAALTLKSGEISGPVRTRFGYHLIRRN